MFATRIENVCLRSYSGSLVPKNLKLESPSRPGKNRAANPFKTLTHVAGENFKLKRICGDSLLCLHHDATVPSGKVGSHSASEHRASTSSIDLAVQGRRGRAPQVQSLHEAQKSKEGNTELPSHSEPGSVARQTTRAEWGAACKGVGEEGWSAHRGWCCVEGRGGRERKGACLPSDSERAARRPPGPGSPRGQVSGNLCGWSLTTA